MARWRSPLAFGPLSTGATQVTGSPRAARYGRQPARRLWTALVAAQVVFAVIFGAFTAADVLPSAAGQETTAYAYDVAAYTYDAPALLSSQSATTTDVRGSPSGPAVVSWGRSASTRCCCSAANTGSRFGSLTHSSSGIAPYSVQRTVTAGQGGSIQAHHLIERRFADVMGQTVGDMPSIVVTRAEHQVFTNAWREAIPYGPNGTGMATRAQVEGAARQIYREYPEILQALGLG